MENNLDNIESEIKIMEAKIRLQEQKNKLELLTDGTVEHFIYGFIKILDNPFLLIVSILLFFIGFLLRGI